MSGPLRVRWIRSEDRAPFQLTSEQWMSVQFDGYAWSADLRELWVGFRTHWIAWNIATGEPVRRATVPDNLRIARPSPEQLLAVEGKREVYNNPQYTPHAWSADLSRCVRERRHRGEPTLCDDNGNVICKLEGFHAPYVFSPDGSLLLGRVSPGSSTAILRARDGELLELHACKLPDNPLTDLVWPERDVVLINIQAPGHRDDELVCKTLDDRVLWSHKGYVRRVQVDTDGAVSAIDWNDHSVWRWDLRTGRVLTHIAKADLPAGPLVFGEPSVAATLEMLRFRPIVFANSEKTHGPIEELRLVGEHIAVRRRVSMRPSWSALDAQGEPIEIAIPGTTMSIEEREVARRAYAGDADKPLEDVALVELVRDPDGEFAICDLQTDGYEQRDPDAGSVWMYTSHLGRWNRREQRWQWVHRELTSQRTYELSWDRTTIVETPGVAYYDVTTGLGRRAPVEPWTPAGRTFVAAREGITLATDDSVVEIYTGTELVGAMELEVGERASSAAIIDARSVVVGTSAGRVIWIDL
jgi:hypothetical protein